MRWIQNILISVFLLIYIVTKTFDYFDLPQSYFVKNYLADLVCMPLVFFLIKWIISKIKAFKKWKKLPLFAILFVTGYWSVYFEYYLPSKSVQYTGDIRDVVMYFLGAILFIIIQELQSYNTIEQKSRRLSNN